MRIERWGPGDAAVIQGCHDVWRAARETDDPLGSPKSAQVLRAWLKHGFQGFPGEVWYVPAQADIRGEGRAPGDGSGPGGGSAPDGSAPDGSGARAIDAWYRLGLPDRENRETAALRILVHPRARRRGLGTELLRHATERALASGRTLLSAEATENSPGQAFAEHFKAERGITEVRRVLDVAAIKPGHLSGLRAQAEPKAAGYTLVTWTGVTPEEHLDRVAAAFDAMNDAPHDASFEPRAFDGQRIREDDARTSEFGFRWYSVAALHDASGEMAALSQAFVDPGHPDWVHQGVTAVIRAHRGHRLGLLVKVAMLDWLAAEEPAAERMATGNAASNQHMIAINEAIGYRVHGPGLVSYEKHTAAERPVGSP